MMRLLLLCLVACSASHEQDWPAGLDPNQTLVSLTQEETLRLCEYSHEQLLEMSGRSPGDPICDPDGLPIGDSGMCTVITPGVVSSCPHTVNDFVRCFEGNYAALADNDWMCRPTEMNPDCYPPPECYLCEEDIDCQRCNSDGCHLPDWVCDVPNEEGERRCVLPTYACSSDDQCQRTPAGDYRWPDATCERSNCVYP